jgi:hypothetical protein
VARRRYQKGSVDFVDGKWRGRWREDVVLADGTVKRLNRRKVLGTKEDFATKRLALRDIMKLWNSTLACSTSARKARIEAEWTPWKRKPEDLDELKETLERLRKIQSEDEVRASLAPRTAMGTSVERVSCRGTTSPYRGTFRGHGRDPIAAHQNRNFEWGCLRSLD